MFIIITLELNSNKYNLKIDDNQKILSGIQVLKDSKKYSGEIPMFLKSKMKQETICSNMTFKDAMVDTGDLLTAIN